MSGLSNAEFEHQEWRAFMRFVVADVLPYLVVFGSLMLKIPQIFTILKNRSASGISPASVIFDMTSCIISTSWGIAQGLQFKDFGESLFITAEVALLLLLVGHFQKRMTFTLVVFLVQMTALVVMSLGVLSRNAHECLLASQIIVDICSRLPQIVMNSRNQSTGQLSFVTFYLAFVGKVSRLLTTSYNVPFEKGKNVLLLQYGVSVGLNALVLVQILTYRKNTEAILRKELLDNNKLQSSEELKNKKRQ